MMAREAGASSGRFGDYTLQACRVGRPARLDGKEMNRLCLLLIIMLCEFRHVSLGISLLLGAIGEFSSGRELRSSTSLGLCLTLGLQTG
jgi:hypothetical protein